MRWLHKSMKTPAKTFLLELIADPGTGKPSCTRVISLMGGLGAIVMFICPKWLGTQDAEVWAMYLAGINGHAVYSKFLSLKFAAAKQTKANKEAD